MGDSLREFVRSVLSEITRYERETGKKYEVASEIESYVSTQVPTPYAFTMTEIPKVGINPKTNFNTPAGIFFYPLDGERYNQLINNRLPYASEAPYCSLLKLNFGGKWLMMKRQGSSHSSEKDKQDALNFALERMKKKAGLFGGVALNASTSAIEYYVLKNGYHFKDHGSIDSFIFDLTYLMTFNEPRSAVAWTTALREMGYIGIFDYGNSILHEAEPWQGVCLEPRAYELVKTFETREVRKQSRQLSSEQVDTKVLKNTKDPERIAKLWKKNENTRDINLLSAFIENFDSPLKVVNDAFLSCARMSPDLVSNTIRLLVPGEPEAPTRLDAARPVPAASQIAALKDSGVDSKIKNIIVMYTQEIEVVAAATDMLEEIFGAQDEDSDAQLPNWRLAERELLNTIYLKMQRFSTSEAGWKETFTKLIKLGKSVPAPEKKDPYTSTYTSVFDPLGAQVASAKQIQTLEAAWNAADTEEKIEAIEKTNTISAVLEGRPRGGSSYLPPGQVINFIKTEIMSSEDPEILQACLKILFGDSFDNTVDEIKFMRAYNWHTGSARDIIPTKKELLGSILKNRFLSPVDRAKVERKLQVLTEFDLEKARKEAESEGARRWAELRADIDRRAQQGNT